MIPVFMILGATVGGAAVVGLVAVFWDNLKQFLKSALKKAQDIVRGVVHGVKVFLKKIQEGCQEISRHYSKVDNHWEETTFTRRIPEDEVPKDILERAKMSHSEIDLTNELEMELSL